MSHFKQVCVCGKVMAQCRCMSPTKDIQIIRPCKHQTTVTDFELPEITIDSLYAAYAKFLNETNGEARTFKCGTAYYEALNEWAKEYVEKMVSESTYKNKTKVVGGIEVRTDWKLFGMRIEVDEKLAPNEWRIEG